LGVTGRIHAHSMNPKSESLLTLQSLVETTLVKRILGGFSLRIPSDTLVGRAI